jgi:hypothetical protein
MCTGLNLRDFLHDFAFLYFHIILSPDIQFLFVIAFYDQTKTSSYPYPYLIPEPPVSNLPESGGSNAIHISFALNIEPFLQKTYKHVLVLHHIKDPIKSSGTLVYTTLNIKPCQVGGKNTKTFQRLLKAYRF